MSAPTVIITGASSGIGRGLAVEFAEAGYSIAMTGRRVELLEQLKTELEVRSNAAIIVCRMDVTDPIESASQMEELIDRLGGLDVAVLNAGAGHRNYELSWENSRLAVETNVLGFTATANAAMRHFIGERHGHIVAISSVAAVRGNGYAPEYGASKAYVSSYCEGLRHLAAKKNADIAVTDIRPGFVDTAMAQGDNVFWVSSVEEAASQMMKAIRRRRKVVYVTKRWRLVAMLMQLMPGWLYRRL